MGQIKRIETVGLKDNDVVIIRIDGNIPPSKVKEIEDTWSKIFEHQGYKNIKVIVLNETLGIEIITRAD